MPSGLVVASDPRSAITLAESAAVSGHSNASLARTTSITASEDVVPVEEDGPRGWLEPLGTPGVAGVAGGVGCPCADVASESAINPTSNPATQLVARGCNDAVGLTITCRIFSPG